MRYWLPAFTILALFSFPGTNGVPRERVSNARPMIKTTPEHGAEIGPMAEPKPISIGDIIMEPKHETPKIIEMAPSPIPINDKTVKVEKNAEGTFDEVLLLPKDTLPLFSDSLPTPVQSKEMPKNQEETLGMEKEDEKKMGETNAFSFKFVPEDNLSRVDSEKSKSSDILKEQNKIQNPNDLPVQELKNEKVPEDLLASESRQRSKIEIKEVNGTLYEYEYIYYYDDEYPTYDYDTPVIGDYDDAAIGAKVKEAATSTAPTTTTTTQPPTTTTTTTTTTPSLVRTRAPSSRSRSRQRVTPEPLPHKENEIIPETSRTSRQRGQRERTTTRQSSRTRGNSRFVNTDNVAAENFVHDLDVDTVKLPAQTRFPPRSRTTTTEAAIPEDYLAFTDEHIAFEEPLLEDVNFGEVEITTTEEGLVPTDPSANTLYALSRALDADYAETTTETPSLYEDETVAPIDYEALYDYDLTLGELAELDSVTTADYETATEEVAATTEPTTTSTTTTTTTPTTTTTSTTTTTPPPTTTTTQSRLRGRRPSLRGRFSQNRVTNRESTNTNTQETEVVTQSTTTTPSGRGRFVRPGLRSRNSFKRRGQATEKPEAEETTTDSNTEVPLSNNVHRSSPRLPSRRRFSRPKPGRRNNLQQQSTPDTPSEDPVSEQTESPVTETTTPPPRARPQPRIRSRRPPASRSNLLGRFNRNRKPAAATEIQEESKVDEEDTTPSSTLVDETPAEVKTEAPKETPARNLPARRQRPNRRHRFNLPNRVSSRTKATVEEAPEQAEAESSPSPQPQEVAEETTTKSSAPTGRGIRRNRVHQRRNRPRISNRFRGKTEVEAQEEVEVAPEAETVQETAVESPSELTTDVESTQPESVVPSPTEESNPAERRFRGRKGHRRRDRKRLPPIFDRVPKAEEIAEKPAAPEVIAEEAKPSPVSDPFAVFEETIDTGDQNQEPQAPEDGAVVEEVTEAPAEAEATTEKLTRRQILAQRRSRFLKSG